MVTSNYKFLESELMDVVRQFPGAEELLIDHSTEARGEKIFNSFFIDGVEKSREDERDGEEEKTALKRYSKLFLYEILSEKYQKRLPWGSVTGIRPTRLAYTEEERGRDFHPLFERLRVSPENIELVGKVLENQRGIREKREGNVDFYVSLPFCPSKCEYCSFITAPIFATRKYLPAYLSALEREISAAKGQIGRLRSIYIGGGTPFALEVEELERVLFAVSQIATEGVEYTVEAGRPDVFSREKLDLCQKYGVTRICINAQSFSDRTLEAIGRKHTRAQLYEAFEMSRDYPFSVNCDLIAGLKGESFAEFSKSVEEAIALSPDNITVHTLCLKKGARLKEERLFGAGKPAVKPLEDGELSEMIAFSRKALTAAGYVPYYLYRQKYMAGSHENVGWTKPGKACIYNVDVMEETTDNLAVGANAISKKVFLQENRIERVASPKDIPTYLEKVEKVIEEKKRYF